MANEMAPARPGHTTRDMLLQARGKLQEVCAQHLPAERLVRLTMAVLTRTPDLFNCSPESILLSVFVAGRLGLEPDGVLGKAYLVPYASTCSLIIGYRGMVELAQRSGKVISVVSRVVREKDEFRQRLGTTEHIDHYPSDDPEPGEMVRVYAVARLSDGSTQFEVMSRQQVDKIRDRARSKKGPWLTDYEEMARKTVVRRLCKSLPSAIETEAAMQLQAGAEAHDPSGTVEAARTLGVDGVVAALESVPAETVPDAKPKSVAELKAEAAAKAQAQ